MKVGDYVRTIYGIKKIISIECGQDIRFDNTNGFDEDLKRHHDNDGISMGDWLFWKNETNLKRSPNIIDLIEVGDYVNGMQVTRICFNEDGERILNLSNCILELINDDIKSIVTREQFESVEYKVGE